jgi:cell fate regulator YaaT (PSP1 superfamily)
MASQQNTSSEETITDQNESNGDQEYINDTPEQDQQELDDQREHSRYQDGQVLRFVRVRFPGNARSFPFNIGKRTFSYGQKVVATSDRGMTVGYINSFPYEVNYSKELDPIRSIARVATDEDLRLQKEFYHKEKDAEKVCVRMIEKYRLDMVLTHVEFIQFGKKAVFYFNAPSRVDFRDLVKELVGELKMRIELRQISVRDRTAAIGAIGACGLQTCCSSFLTTYGNVSIKMAKNQNLALIPSKINGVCGQLKCCVKYEDDVYTDKRNRLPRENNIVKLRNNDIGKVLRLNILEEQFDMITDRGVIKRFTARVYNPKLSSPGQDYRFPESFDSVENQTSQLVDWQIDDLATKPAAADPGAAATVATAAPLNSEKLNGDAHPVTLKKPQNDDSENDFDENSDVHEDEADDSGESEESQGSKENLQARHNEGEANKQANAGQGRPNQNQNKRNRQRFRKKKK